MILYFKNLSSSKKAFWCFVTIAVGFIIWGLQSQTRSPNNAKIGWGQVCTDGICRPAALLLGDIPFKTQYLIDELNTKKDIKILCLDSRGGNSKGANDLANWLNEQKYDTCLPVFTGKEKMFSLCASACTNIFVAGQQRTMTPGAIFQIHSGSTLLRDWLYGEPEEDTPVARPPSTWVKLAELFNQAATLLSKSTRWLTELDSPAAKKLSREAAMTPSYRLRRISQQELFEWGVLTVQPSSEIAFKK